MDDRGSRQPPYVAILSLLWWADEDWPWLDGTMQQRGIDIYEVQRKPLHRYIALLYSLMVERCQWLEADERKKNLDILEWPETIERRDLDESDKMARENIRKLGFDPDEFLAPRDTGA